jgi:hypothetical protein
MTAISEAVASERAKRYRELAYEARVQAALCKRTPRYEQAYVHMAERWEELAREAEEDVHVVTFLEKACPTSAPLAEKPC